MMLWVTGTCNCHLDGIDRPFSEWKSPSAIYINCSLLVLITTCGHVMLIELKLKLCHPHLSHALHTNTPQRVITSPSVQTDTRCKFIGITVIIIPVRGLSCQCHPHLASVC